MAVSRVVLYFNCSSVSSVSHPTNLSSFAKTTPYTYSRIKGKDNGGGSGWSDDGKALYDDLFCRVKENRAMYGKTFYQELLKIYQQRRNKRKGSNITKQAHPQIKDATDV
jgi:hypothetical protein